MRKFSFLAVACAFVFGVHADMFKDGDTVVFLGDSITHASPYLYNVYDYYLTRFPSATIRFVNAGVAGDSAGECQDRFKEDVVDKKPTKVCVMFGMNDIKTDLYAVKRTPEQIEAGAKKIASYRENMKRIVSRLATEAGNPAVIFMTPSIYDDRVVQTNSIGLNSFGSRDALGECADVVRELCAANRGTLVDFYTPMTAYTRRRQKTEPHFSLIGDDRVHPGEEGAFFMAWRFLVSQGADALVSDVTINAADGRCDKSLNADVSELTISADGVISFTLLEKALPFPCHPSVRKFASELPIADELNQEILSVTGLADGSYTLTIDGAEVATHTANEWSDGINLAMNEKTPQFKHAMEVHRQARHRREIEVKTRHWAAERWFLRYFRLKNMEDPAELQVLVDNFRKNGESGYFKDMLPRYIKEWPNRHRVYEELEEATRKLLDMRRPFPHHFVLKKVGRVEREPYD